MAATRAPQRRVLAGICARIAERYGIHAGLVRAAWLLVTVLSGGFAALLYVVLWALGAGAPVALDGGTAGEVSAESLRAARVVEWLLWVFLGLLLLQVYLAGVFVLGGVDGQAMHRSLGYLLAHFYPLIIAAAALLARMPGRFWATFGVLFVLLSIQPVFVHLPTVDGLGWGRALHAPNAVAIIVLVYQLARSVHRTRRTSDAAATPAARASSTEVR